MHKWYWLVAAIALVLAADTAQAQTPPANFAPPPMQQQSFGAQEAFTLGFSAGQQVAIEVEKLKARISELEKKCGDVCKK